VGILKRFLMTFLEEMTWFQAVSPCSDARQRAIASGAARLTAPRRASWGRITCSGAARRDRASASRLCSDGRWPTLKSHPALLCLQEIYFATANMSPEPVRASASCNAAVLSPRTATDFPPNRPHQRIRQIINARNSQKLWCLGSPVTMPR
jgi:hypothetical protein